MQPQTTGSMASQPAQPVQPAPPAQNAVPDTGYPVTVSFDMPAKQSRIMALFGIPFFLVRLLLLIPHYIIVNFLSIAILVAAWINMWVVLFSGHSSPGLYRIMSGTLRWSTRVSSYTYGLNDKYPPFSLN